MKPKATRPYISPVIYRWKHPSLGERVCTQHELCKSIGLDRRPINNVALRGKRSYKGWTIVRQEP